jgi:hypothetical protein
VPHAFNSIDGIVVDPSLQYNRPRTYKILHTFPPERILGRQRQCEKEGHSRIFIAQLPGKYRDLSSDEIIEIEPGKKKS